MSTHKEPTYIPRAAEEVFTGPSEFRNVTMYGFVVRAGSRLLDETLKRYIDRPSQGLGLRVTAGTTLQNVLLLFIESERVQPLILSSTGRETGSAASHPERLFAVVVFGSRTRPTPAPIAFAPYVYASSTPGWRTEREIFGYPQQLASISIPKGANGKLPSRLKVEASGIRKFGPEQISKRQRILRIVKKRGPETEVSPDELARAIADALTAQHDGAENDAATSARGPAVRRPRRRQRRRACADLVTTPRFGITAAELSFFKRFVREPAEEDVEPTDQPEPEPLADASSVSRALLSGSFRMHFLKQFRDIAYADRACYQAIIEGAISAGGYKRGLISRDYRLRLEELDSAPIGRELGVPPRSDVTLAFRVDFETMRIGDEATSGTVISNPFWDPAEEFSTRDEPSRLPRYVERGGEAVWRQPSLLYGARIYGFGIKVPMEKQKEVLNQYINDVVDQSTFTYGTKKKFRLSPCAGLGVVMLMFVEYDRVTSASDDDRRLGGVRYKEFLATQLALCDDDDFPELDWLIPFIYLDEDAPRLGGREIFGYPKQLATIPPFERFRVGGLEIEPARRLELQATVISNPGDKSARFAPVVRVEGKSPPGTEQRYETAADMIKDLLQVTAPSLMQGLRPGRLFSLDAGRNAGGGNDESSRRGVDALSALISGGVGHVFLKQFRDSTHPKNPCYQAVCKTDTVPARFRGGARLTADAYRITIADSASERLLAYLGLTRTAGPQELTPAFAYWMHLDVELTTGRMIANSFKSQLVPDRSKPDMADGGTQRIRQSGEPTL